MTTDEIRALLAAATPGPWCLGEDGQGNLYIGSLIAGAPEKVAGFFKIPADHENLSAEARLIISAPTIAALAITQAEEIERLRELLTEALGDISTYVDQDYPADTCQQYPDIARRHFRDMELCRRIDAALAQMEGKE